MAGRSRHWSWRAAAAACCLAWAVTSLTGATAVIGTKSIPSHATGRSLRVLQFNLCDSGIAACYTGRSVHAAAAVMRHWRPDVVTLNEVCRHDVFELERAISESHRGRAVAAAFQAAVDRPTDSPFRCRNGQPYGIGVLAVLGSATSRHRAYRGRYPVQDLRDPEERVWLCIRAAGGFYACTTHTASTSETVARSQCRYLLRRAVPALLARAGGDPVVLGADLNLLPGHSPGPQDCLTDGYHRVDDGARQDIVTSPGLTVTHRLIIDMHGTTDHPGLLVDVAAAK
jgi:endonuclease/exonuclease/phosphatase family metal-dependent hydrolase